MKAFILVFIFTYLLAYFISSGRLGVGMVKENIEIINGEITFPDCMFTRK